MLMQIFSHTPTWVWIVLALLIWRGLAASKTRELSLRQALLLPILMPILSLAGLVSAFGSTTLAPLYWLAGGALAASARWRLSSEVVADPVHGTVRIPGSWLPLALMMGIFVMKYIVAILLAMHPVWRLDSGFIAVVSLLYGIFSGLFFGNVLRIVAAWRAASGNGLGYSTATIRSE